MGIFLLFRIIVPFLRLRVVGSGTNIKSPSNTIVICVHPWKNISLFPFWRYPSSKVPVSRMRYGNSVGILSMGSQYIILIILWFDHSVPCISIFRWYHTWLHVVTYRGECISNSPIARVISILSPFHISPYCRLRVWFTRSMNPFALTNCHKKIGLLSESTPSNE